MKIKGKKIIAVLCAVCVLNFMAAGCGNDSVQGNVNVEDNFSESKEEGDDSGQEEIGAGTSDTTEPVDTMETGDMTDPADTTEPAVEGRWHVLAPDIAAVVDADFTGTVIKIDADAFYIAEIQTEIMEDGSLLAIEASTESQIPDSDLVQVIFEEDTRFYIRTIYENGARYEDTEASFKDLIQNMSVELKGEFVGDIFHAKEIRMIKTEK